MKNIKYFLKVITTPSCWIQVDKYSKDWDDILNKLLEKENFKDFGTHRAKIGNTEVWVSNMPYGAFSVTLDNKTVLRPKRTTIFKAYEKYLRDYLIHNTGGW